MNWWRNEAVKPLFAIMFFTHVLGLLAFFPRFFSWSGVAICVFLYILTAWGGITLCFHRLLTHKSYETFGWVRWCLTLFGCLAWEGSPIKWVGDHRWHHKESDTDEDIHSPRHGFSWAHYLWMVTKRKPGYSSERQAGDLQKEAMMRFFDKYGWLAQIILAVIVYFAGWMFEGHRLAQSWIVWGFGVRIPAVWAATWFVNSASHTWGHKHPGARDNSRNLWWVAIIAGGEGWHSNHHVYPSSAAHGMRWYELDPTYWAINIMSFLGLAWEINRPPKAKKT